MTEQHRGRPGRARHGGRGDQPVPRGPRRLAAERERSALEALLRRQISGLIVACVSADQSYLAPWQERTPMVFVDRAPKGLSGVYVIEDDLGGAREAVTHLASHGHRRVAFLGVSTPVTTTQRRLKGYRSAVADERAGRPSRSRLHARRVGRRGRRRAGEAAGGAGRLPPPSSPRTSPARWRSSWPCSRRSAPTSPWSGSATSPWRRPSPRRSRSWIRTRPGSGASPSKGSSSASRIPHAPSCAAGPCSRSS